MVVEMQSLGDALWAVALSAGVMIAHAISIVAVAAAMQRRARGRAFVPASSIRC